MGIMAQQETIRAGYKQTEVGVIPEGWDILSLGAVCDVRDGTHESPRFFRQGVPFVTSKNIIDGRLDLKNVSYISEQDAAEFNRRSQVDRNDILMSMIGTIGSAVLVDQKPTFCIKNVALIKPQQIDPEFLIQLIKSPQFQEYLASSLEGGIQKFVALGTLRQLAIPAPKLPEQHAIAKALGDVDDLIGALDQLIGKKRDLKQTAMQQLLTGKERLPGFHSKWDDCQIRDIADVKTGPFGSSLHERDYVNDGTPIITVEHLDEFGVLHSNLPMVSEADRQRLKAYALEEDDIVFSRVGSIDRNALIRSAEVGWLFSGRLLRLRLDRKKVFAPYLSYQFHGEVFKSRVRSVAVGQTMPSLNTQILNGIDVVLPPLSEQTAIAAVLSDMDAEITALEKRRDKTHTLQQGMMQELLTGKIRLI